MSKRKFWSKSALLLCMVISAAAGTPAVPSLGRPTVTVDLRKFGWMPPIVQSDKEFFKDFSIAKLEAVDFHTHIAFLSDELIVAYHMIPDRRRDWRTGAEMEAFFIRTGDGSLLTIKTWPTMPRREGGESWETEGRILRVSDQIFLVHANGVIMLYKLDHGELQLLREKKLEFNGPRDFWAVQSALGGLYLVLRHGSLGDPEAAYWWVDSKTLEETRYEVTTSLWVPIAIDNFLVGGSPRGLEMARAKESTKLLCDDPNCRGAGVVALSAHHLALERSNNFGVLDLNQGVLWMDGLERKHVPQFGSLSASASGERFALWAQAVEDPWFHNVRISSPVMFIYDANGPNPLYTLRLKSFQGEFAFRLSPDGKHVAVFDANGLRIYPVR